jgi:formylglycine-generating enzyme required for sulfatase activity
LDGACVGSCTPGSKRCSSDGNRAETCSDTGTWPAGVKCSYPNQSCSDGVCGTNPSCAGPLNKCGSSSNDGCCVNSLVVGGDYYRGYNGSNYTDTGYPATVADFRLDKYEVTVGRFRNFVTAYVAGWRPPTNGGKHTHLFAGAGLKAGAGNEPGWDSSWTSGLPTTQAGWNTNLGAAGGTWTSANENVPIDLVNWREAYAFCIWDGGFLPSEAEWNYAAAGGNEHRYYAWSNPASSTTISSSYAVYYDGTAHPLASVGSKPSGKGKWNQLDLLGNTYEWVMDQGNAIAASGGNPVIPYATPCDNCMTTSTDGKRIVRGGHATTADYDLVVARRWSNAETGRGTLFGFRCAYEP